MYYGADERDPTSTIALQLAMRFSDFQKAIAPDTSGDGFGDNTRRLLDAMMPEPEPGYQRILTRELSARLALEWGVDRAHELERLGGEVLDAANAYDRASVIDDEGATSEKIALYGAALNYWDFVCEVERAAAKDEGLLEDYSAEAKAKKQSKESAQDRQARRRGEALMLVKEHPEWADTKVADYIGCDKGTLSRDKEYKDYAANIRTMASREPAKGHARADPETGEPISPEAHADDE